MQVHAHTDPRWSRRARDNKTENERKQGKKTENRKTERGTTKEKEKRKRKKKKEAANHISLGKCAKLTHAHTLCLFPLSPVCLLPSLRFTPTQT